MNSPQIEAAQRVIRSLERALSNPSSPMTVQSSTVDALRHFAEYVNAVQRDASATQQELASMRRRLDLLEAQAPASPR